MEVGGVGNANAGVEHLGALGECHEDRPVRISLLVQPFRDGLNGGDGAVRIACRTPAARAPWVAPLLGRDNPAILQVGDLCRRQLAATYRDPAAVQVVNEFSQGVADAPHAQQATRTVFALR